MIGLVSNFSFRIFGRIRKLPKRDPKLIKLLKSFLEICESFRLSTNSDSIFILILFKGFSIKLEYTFISFRDFKTSLSYNSFDIKADPIFLSNSTILKVFQDKVFF
jgi:hypothetical protein